MIGKRYLPIALLLLVLCGFGLKALAQEPPLIILSADEVTAYVPPGLDEEDAYYFRSRDDSISFVYQKYADDFYLALFSVLGVESRYWWEYDLEESSMEFYGDIEEFSPEEILSRFSGLEDGDFIRPTDETDLRDKGIYTLEQLIGDLCHSDPLCKSATVSVGSIQILDTAGESSLRDILVFGLYFEAPPACPDEGGHWLPWIYLGSGMFAYAPEFWPSGITSCN